MTENEIARSIVNAAFDVHRKTGPGLLESAYEFALAFDLRDTDILHFAPLREMVLNLDLKVINILGGKIKKGCRKTAFFNE